jgi:hypothetical protein
MELLKSFSICIIFKVMTQDKITKGVSTDREQD